ncbi:hypothetical protein BG015_011270 [Linnemannia schmuckeri]|uniref:N-acetyltransferase domain-containing protein n=1 Tax=Linnemannia schmuckeri TaxID=64567 RepID=A0A9P5S7C5_9FUNG|nr:hypothetical protein BG015_011270 [Linnemannia schmuckeri]
MSSSSLKVHPLTSQNRAGVAQLVFDSHMKSVTPLFHFLKLRPLALLLWTAIATGIFKYRQTSLGSYLEILTVMAGAVIVAQGVLFLTLLYEASTTAPGHLGVGQLEVFGDQDRQEDGETSSSKAASAGGAKKRNVTESATTTTTPSGTKEEEETVVKGGSLAGKDNKFFVLEKSGRVIGCIGAVVDRTKNEATLTNWAVNTDDQRRGAGTHLLKTLMDAIAESSKKEKIQTVRVKLQGYQVPALRLFHKFGFVQTDRTPEWMGERVALEMSVKDWGRNLAKAKAEAQKQE